MEAARPSHTFITACVSCRFYTPPWGPTPIPDGVTVDPALAETNGYDFRNDQSGDTYVFLLGSDLTGWHAARTE